ncbi:cytochrome P450 9b2-like [Teleopsis dalmanni]|uniref:cytochrome P450 9b2-like n=1 Tax=Teleopsis dalmanni TaxID=139649 RepID=UPI0018CEF40B|nr:cytochrome P450 9b2-like [Teleopsis dalmanni]
MVALELVLIAIASLFLLYKWLTATYNTFELRGVPYEKPYPLVGNFGAVVLNKESMRKSFIEFYKRNKLHKVVGFYNFRTPAFIINDPELVKKLAVKDFESFPNHAPFFNADDEPLFAGMLSIMKDQRWKDMRNTLTPVFTAAKMRSMLPLMNECFLECINNLNKKLEGGSCELEMKQFFTRLTNDIIATTAFGISINSYENPKNEFYDIGQSITNFKGAQMLKFMLSNVMPWLLKFLGVRVFDAHKTDYFMRLVVDSMKYREKHNIVRPDMIQLLMEAKKESTQNWSDIDIVAQCFVFFFAAFENNANLICATCHELMENPDIQQRVYEECVEIKAELKEETLNYETTNKMKYMEMVLNETLRRWAFAPFTDRVCSKDYKLTDDDDKLLFEFKVGDRIFFPIGGFQLDEKYFENPDVFDPERFSDENKGNIVPFTNIPFGVGPRICIGNRYALMQAKAILYYLVTNYKLERSEKTVKNVFDEMRGFQVTPNGGFWLRFVSRT